MTKGFEHVARLFFLGVIVLAGCGAPAELPTPAPLTPQVTLQPSTPTATTPTPRPPSSPLVIDRLPARGEELQPDQPIEIVFDQPMDRRSVEQALQVRASDGTLVAGTLTWKSDSVVVFKPAQPWLQAERYTVSLAAEAKSAKGFALARPEQFEVNTVGKLAVAQTLPQDGAMDVTADAAITVLFNRPVVPLTALSEQSTLPQPLVLEPAVEGRGEWLNTSIYLFRPTQPLQAGVAYRARVPAGLRDTTGSVLDADYGWTFTVAPPVVKFVLPAPGSPPVDLRQPITVVFSQRMDRASAQAAFSIQPPVRGSFRWSEETPDLAPAPGAPTAAGEPTPSALLGTSRGEVMTFIPEENYERGQGYVVTVRAGARAAAGSGATTQPTVFGFTTFPLPEVIGTVPADGATQADPNSSFVIRFNAPISVPTILPNLTFEPPVSLTRVYSFYDRFSNEFFLGVQLAPSTAYRVRIGGGATDQYGVPLGKDTEVRFTTAPLQPFVALENEGFVGVYNASRPTRLFVAHRNVTRIDLELVRLSLEEFYQFTGAVNSFERVQTYKPQPEALLRRWSERVTPELNQLKRLRLDLVEGGGSLPTGVYLLSVSAPELNQPETNPVQVVRHILVVSDLHVTLKHGDTSGLVWVTDLNTSQPLGGVEVTFRDHTFSEIARAQTSSAADTLGQALVSLPASYKPYRTLYAVVGQPGGRFGIAWSEMSRGIAIYDFGLPGRYFAEPYLVYLFTDRPIYRPGQRVFFKGYVRRDNDARYSLPDVPAVQVAIESFNGFRVFSQTLRLDDNGGFEGELALDQRITPGTYFIQVCVPLQPVKDPEEPTCAFGSTFFAVAAYRAPEFEVSVSADKTDYLDGEIMQFTIEARYFFGGAVANASVRWSLMAEDYLFDRYRGPGLYDFGDYDVFLTDSRLFPGFSEPVANGEGVTDSQGRLVLRLPADLSKRRTSARFTLEATVTDANDQSASARQSVVAHKAPVYFGVSTEGYVYEVGSPITVNVIAVDWQGKPLAGQTGELVFSQREWMTVQEEDPQGQVFYTSNPSDTVISKITITTDAEGRASATFTPQAGGEHRVKIANAARSIFVADPSRYVGWRIENNDRIELQADKDTYEVGEVARVLVPSPFQGTVSALLTVERGSFLQRRTLTLNNNSTVLEIPIEESFAPNAYVSVLLVKGVDATNPVPAFRLGYTSFRVSPKLLTLNVQITPDKTTYAPRETATYEIRVTDAAGNPAQADLSLALVDKAVLGLFEQNVQPVVDAFYGERGLSVRTADTLSVNVDRVTERLAAAQAEGKGGGGSGDMASVEFTRQLFKDTAYWSATLRTDANGIVRVQVPLPDNLTTWVMTARAVGRDSRVGEATSEVVATKLLLVRPVTPRFFVAGDVVTLGAVVNNNTTEPISAQVAIASTNLVLVEGQPIQRVTVPARGAARVNWRMSVQDADRSEITMTVSGGGLFDSTQPGLQTAEGGGIPILRYAAPETIATAGDMAQLGRRVELIAIPPRLNTGRGDLTVRVDTSLAAAALRSAKAVEAYEFESTDWAATRLIIALALARARNQQPDQGVVSSALQRFYATQLPNGGWGWWFGDQFNPLVTAHVLFALAQAQQAGVPVNADALNRGVDALRAQLLPAIDLPSMEQANQQAYYLFVLGELGQTDAAQANALYEQRVKLGHYGKALLALTLNRLQPGDSRIATLLADIISAAALSATGASWREQELPWVNQSSDTRSTATILYALARLDAQNALIPNVARWLLSARSGDSWSSLQETEWAILALSAWLQASGEGSGSFAWRVALNDRAILNGLAATPDDAQTVRLAVAELFSDRINELAFERAAGQGRLYYTAHLRLFVPAESAPAVNRGIAIARKYERADCTPKLDKPCEAITSARVGEEVRVRLTIVAPRDLHFVRLIDRLPAGAEAIDTTLKTTASLRRDLPMLGAFSPEGWGWWWFGHQQVYDDRVAVFAAFLPAGTYEYTYLFRPSLAGEFQTMPASVELEYFPEVFGRSAGARFVIAPR